MNLLALGPLWLLLMLSVVLGSQLALPTDQDQSQALYDQALAQLQTVSPARFPPNPLDTDEFGRVMNFLQGLAGRLVSQDYTQTSSSQDDDECRAQAVQLLQKSAELGHSEALRTLADLHFYGNYSHPRDFGKAQAYYQALASLGDAEAQFMVGLGHSTGLFGAVAVDQAKATLYYTFAAVGGSARAQMAMGFRNLAAVAVDEDSKTAYRYYQSAADQALQYLAEGPTPISNRRLCNSAWILPDELVGGVYGPGASASHSSAEDLFPSGISSYEEAIDYFMYLSEENDSASAAYALAILYYDGGRYCDRDDKKALEHAYICANKFWGTKAAGTALSSANFATLDPTLKRIAGGCAKMIGSYYLRGEIVAQNLTRARAWLQRGVNADSATSKALLAQMYLHGMGPEDDKDEPTDGHAAKGMDLLREAAKQSSPMAELQLGLLELGSDQLMSGAGHIDSAAKAGHLEALYYRAKLLAQGVYADKKDGIKDNFAQAALTLKDFCESVDELYSPLQWAHAKFRVGDVEAALVGFLIGAEMGFESAQVNVAHILDDHRGMLSFDGSPSLQALPDLYSNASSTALTYWTRASKQEYVDAQIKMGDYYLKGLGADRDPEKAVLCYMAAARKGSPQAYWNLGWMYENGLGVECDYHLAKRYYDLALTVSREALLPTKLAVLNLYVKSIWNSWTGGQIRSISDDKAETGSLVGYAMSRVRAWGRLMRFFVNPSGFDEVNGQHGQDGQDGPDDDTTMKVVFVLTVLVAVTIGWYLSRRVD